MILPALSDDRYEIFTTDLLWIEVCQNAVLSKIDIELLWRQSTKNFEIDKSRILRALDPLPKIRFQELLKL